MHTRTRSSSLSFSVSTFSPRWTRSRVACWQVGITSIPEPAAFSAVSCHSRLKTAPRNLRCDAWEYRSASLVPMLLADLCPWQVRGHSAMDGLAKDSGHQASAGPAHRRQPCQGISPARTPCGCAGSLHQEVSGSVALRKSRHAPDGLLLPQDWAEAITMNAVFHIPYCCGDGQQ